MSLTVEPQLVPLTTSPEGIVRVSGTRVTLDTVVSAFLDGATPETIAQQYPSLSLADVYAVISYYLRNRATVDGYLAQSQAAAAQVRQHNEARWDPTGVRARLLARDASTGRDA
jgi:uncharacterized protein (DUF433 family)